MEDLCSSIEDQLLVMDAQDGDAGAMEKLVCRWQKRLWHHAFRLTSDCQAAWDITQQTWLAVIKGLRKLHDPANFRAWAYRITTNKSIDWIKRNEAEKHADIARLPEIEQPASSDTGLIELLAKLDFRKRAVLCLHYFERLSLAEIGEVLKIPKGTVKSRLHSARNELKEMYEEQLQ